MNKLTIIVALLISSIAVAQPGKGDHSKSNSKKEVSGNQNNDHGHQSGQSNKSQQNERGNVFVADQGKKDQGNNNSKQRDNQNPLSKGHDKIGTAQPHNGNNKSNQNQNKGKQDSRHEVNGKQYKGHPGSSNGKQYKGQPGNGKHFKGHKGNGHKGNGHFVKGNPGKGNGKHYKGHKGNGHYAKGHPGKMHYGKGHPNYGYVYVNQRGYYSGREYGQWRAAQARNKHRAYHPIYEYQAIEGYNFIVVRNRFLYSETDYKINLLRIRLAERRDAGLITVVAYDDNIRRVELIEKRRAAIHLSVEI